jgi:hypothetical protein
MYSKNIFPEMKQRSLPHSPFLHACIRERFIYSHDQSSADRSCKYINRSQARECGNWEIKHYNSIFEITRPPSVSFLGIHKSEPDIYIVFSFISFHLQCTVYSDALEDHGVLQVLSEQVPRSQRHDPFLGVCTVEDGGWGGEGGICQVQSVSNLIARVLGPHL